MYRMVSFKVALLALVYFLSIALGGDSRSKGKDHDGKDRNGKDCLNKHEAEDIVERWISQFEAKDAAVSASIADGLVSNDFTFEDETVNFFFGPCLLPIEGPYVTSKARFIESLGFRATTSILGPENFTPLDIVADCDSIAFRWRLESTALGVPNKYGSAQK